MNSALQTNVDQALEVLTTHHAIIPQSGGIRLTIEQLQDQLAHMEARATLAEEKLHSTIVVLAEAQTLLNTANQEVRLQDLYKSQALELAENILEGLHWIGIKDLAQAVVDAAKK